jgi:hypothetical protein
VSTHIVHKQKVDLKISRSEDSFALQSRVSYLLQHELLKKMEMIFDEFAAHEEIIRIDQLHLDLKPINPKNFEKEFEERFIEQLKSKLRKVKGSKNNNAVTIKKQDSLLHSLIYFLEHGYLAWYDAVKAMQSWEEEILNHLPEKDWEYFSNWLKKNYSGNNQIIERLTLQFSDHFLHFVIAKMNVYPADVFKDVYEDLFFILQAASNQRKDATRNFLWQSIIKVLVKHGKSETEYWMLKNIFSKRSDLRNVFTHLKNEELIRNIKTATIQNAVEKLIDSSTDKDDDLIFEEDVISKQEKQQLKEDALYVNGCGIVILHPFLEMYFTESGLMIDRQFVNDDACKHSVLLLHYLATGETYVAEFDLVLQKIFCGLPLEETLPSAIELSEKEISESENLLRSVMNYWPPLKNTSIEGLRQTFLQRDGKLSQTETGWLLRIEQKTVDILLGKLPWGFSTIQLPWMKNLLSVEWC